MSNETLLIVLGLSVQLVGAQTAVPNSPTPSAPSSPSGSQPGYVSAEFIAEHPAAPSCHASTVVEGERAGELLAAWFGGSDEGARDVVIWMSRYDGRAWSRPEEVANGVHEKVRIQYPCWNPVLFRMRNGPL